MDTSAVIDLEALRWNAVQIQNYVNPVPVCAVIKADAYGHGAYEIARELINVGIEHFCVALVKEGVGLRKKGINKPILVLSPTEYDEIESTVQYGLELTVTSCEQANVISEQVKKLGKEIAVHIYIDTGMQRGGVYWQDARKEIGKIAQCNWLNIKGIYTHCAAADESDLTFTSTQLDRFDSAIQGCKGTIPAVHAAGSGALLQMPESHCTMVRPGISLYGYFPSRECKQAVQLKPVMSVKSKVADVRLYHALEGIGYSLTYKVDQPTRIVSVPIGYDDGVNRLLSNKGSVLIRGKRFPIVGIVAMDWIMVDIGDDASVHSGDEVILLGKQGEQEITIHEWCEIVHTIPHEVLCNFTGRLQKQYINAS